MPPAEYYVDRIEEGLIPGLAFSRLEVLVFRGGKGKELLRMEEEVKVLYNKLVDIFSDEIREFWGVIQLESHPLIQASDISSMARCFQGALENGEFNMTQSKLDAFCKHAGLGNNGKPESGPLTRVSFSENSEYAKLLAQGQKEAYWAPLSLIENGLLREGGIYYDQIFAQVRKETIYVSQRMYVPNDSFIRFCKFGEIVRLCGVPKFYPFTTTGGKVLEDLFFIESNSVKALPDVGMPVVKDGNYNFTRIFCDQRNKVNYLLEGGGFISIEVVEDFLRKRMSP